MKRPSAGIRAATPAAAAPTSNPNPSQTSTWPGATSPSETAAPASVVAFNASAPVQALNRPAKGTVPKSTITQSV